MGTYLAGRRIGYRLIYVILAMGIASIEDGVSHSQFVFDPDAKKVFHTAKASMIADAMLVRNLLVQVADSLEQYGRSVSSDEIRSAYEQVKTIDNLDKALDILESETESAVSQISGMLAGQISDGTLSGLSADEVKQIEEIAIGSEDRLSSKWADCVTRVIDGKTMILPKPGNTVTVSFGIDLPSQQRDIASCDTWSREYSVYGVNTIQTFKGKLCCRRLNYAIDTLPCNYAEDDLLRFEITGDIPCYAGAMIEGFANIGDIVEVTLDDGVQFNFLILDVKSKAHTYSELGGLQYQNEFGHGYSDINNPNKNAQPSICEFITGGNLTVSNVRNAPSGQFLVGRRVDSATIVAHLKIDDNYTGSIAFFDIVEND